ncbi:BREX-1 system adenine-specific DNA-methyltransferase PglX [Salinibacterium amurskyense]|uniref:BREX-1 system adenine-specific DNA-methyltransferase PglX n=1 Tax=Salinibacterium amurskyense TaxID=205941 RepID=UPI00311ED359
MDTSSLKNFAAGARSALHAEVAARLAVVLAEGSAARAEQAPAVSALERATERDGRDAVVERVAYTWFNRIIALRFMDANGYTGVGVLSPEAGKDVGQPQVLSDAKGGEFDSNVVSPKLQAEITALLNGTRQSGDGQGEAYGLLLEAYCRFWNRSMPFMFERKGDYTELLMPTGLLASDSVRDRAVRTMTTEACSEVEVIGWLYQFYISERKDEVFAGFKKNKKAGAAEIPAATQLFTPHWIVRYLVENSVGRLWLLNHPESRLAEQMDYYIAPVDEETDFLKIGSPEELKIIDPAVGSGHMLTYAFDLLYAIYEEQAYSPSEISAKILEHNLFGVEIDPRAGALAAFALTMKATAKRKLFLKTPVQPKICVLQNVHFEQADLDYLWTFAKDMSVARTDFDSFWNAFEHADTFGSLVQPDERLTTLLTPLVTQLEAGGNLLGSRVRRVIEQSDQLTRQYSVAIANPPYMSSRNMSDELSRLAGERYPDTRSDTFAMFIERCAALIVRGGTIAIVTMQTWMFLTSYQDLRATIVRDYPIRTLAHLGSGAFATIGGDVVSTVAFTLGSSSFDGRATYVRAVEAKSSEGKDSLLRAAAGDPSHPAVFAVSVEAMQNVPELPIAYWLSGAQLATFASGRLVRDVATVKKGMDTGNNNRFLRRWYEVSSNRNAVFTGSTSSKWIPYNKGGGARRWYGHREFLLNWNGDGHELKEAQKNASARARVANEELFFTEGFTWSTVSPGAFGIRLTPPDAAFDNGGSTLYSAKREDLLAIGGLLNTRLAASILQFMAPTINTQPGEVGRMPVPERLPDTASLVEQAVATAREDWASAEETMEFEWPSVLVKDGSLLRRVAAVIEEVAEREASIRRLEEELEGEYWRAFNLGGSPTDLPNRGTLFREVDATSVMKDLVSYAVGCMVGRFSTDKPGLILADQGSTIQDFATQVSGPAFAPDADNVLPIVDDTWFDDDIVSRFRHFLRVTFGEEHFEENLRFVIDNLGVKDLRDYFVKSFYKDHVQRYKKRPIYWLFSSPKGAFTALVYLHRYTPTTVSTVLNEYLREFIKKLEASLEQQNYIVASGAAAREIAAAQKEANRLRKVLIELDDYERQLHTLAAQQIELDLDDGVLVNYQKFGSALRDIGLKKSGANG